MISTLKIILLALVAVPAVFAQNLSQPAIILIHGAPGQPRPVYLQIGPKDPVPARILSEALALASSSGIRPYWTDVPFSIGENVPAADASDVIAHLIPCENIARLRDPSSTAKVLDGNHYFSYGILQIQSSTWQGWVKGGWTTGDPENDTDAINAALIAIEHGQLNHWSCAAILHIVQ